MNLAQTETLANVQKREAVSSHEIISFLMEGALERAEQAILAIRREDRDEAIRVSRKLTAIISGLQNCLDAELGEVAENLDALYDYMIIRLSGAGESGNEAAFAEVKALLAQIKVGWNNIAPRSLS